MTVLYGVKHFSAGEVGGALLWPSQGEWGSSGTVHIKGCLP